jgi:hypothetical protein
MKTDMTSSHHVQICPPQRKSGPAEKMRGMTLSGYRLWHTEPAPSDTRRLDVCAFVRFILPAVT